MRPVHLAALMLAAAPVLMLGACQPKVQAPKDQDVCYFIGHVKEPGETKTSLKFNVLGKNVPDMEHCAVLLYNARRSLLATNTAGKETEGAYNGSFLLATNHDVRSSTTYEGPYFPFLVKAPDNRLVAPGSIQVDEDETQGDGKQQTVAIPKNLPQMPSDQKK
ncbi:MAG: hypothetical protein ACXU8U_11130 [Asticcacaulis sp.]